MDGSLSGTRLTRRLVDSLYIEAMVLADEARAYFEDHGTEEREALPPARRVDFAIESLRVTTRIMHVVAWLLIRRAVETGEIAESEGRAADRRLGPAEPYDPRAAEGLPERARQLIVASEELYERVRRIEHDVLAPEPHSPGPARALLGKLERAF